MTLKTVTTTIEPHQLTAQLPETLFTESHHIDTIDQPFVGHERAKEALEFGLAMNAVGFNVFAMGEQGTGRQTLIKQMLTETAKNQTTPEEWCYIKNFDDSHAPYKLFLSPGDGKQLVARINTFIDDLLALFPELFDNPSYQRQKAAIDREFNQQYDEAITKVEETALTYNVMLIEENGEIGFSPVVDGKPLNENELASLDEAKRKEFFTALAELETLLSEELIELPKWKRLSIDKLKKLKNETAAQSIQPLLKELEHEFSSSLCVLQYLSTVKVHVVETVLDILVGEDNEKQKKKDNRKLMVEHFLPNLLVAREANEGAPVVYEQNPTYQNLFGHADFSSFQGNSYTSYRLIRPGALHKANGGYLLLDAEKILNQPLVWARLKLAIKTQEVTIENPYSEYSQPGSYSLQPEKIPLKIKIILLGDPDIYFSLHAYDQEFNELFRVLADFDRYLDKNNDNLIAYANLIRQRAYKNQYPNVSNDAVVELIKYALRREEHQHKISANIVIANDILDEANYLWHKNNEQGDLSAKHIKLALSAKQRRTGKISETWLSEIKERQVLITTQGKQIGKVNGLTVLEIGESIFGTPARITATVYAGSQGVTDIEREVDLGKSIHSKGFLLLTGYLGHKYGQKFPVSISANIAIEQSYGHIDGDSASMAELCALISAITHLPINQSIAITGSINQHGEVQSIGGVNEKIEGFYRLCKDRGLTGKQGVIIPRTNVINLMLNDEVIAAVEKGEFAIHAVEDIDQSLTILLGTIAGKPNTLGRYPRKTIHGLALEKLSSYTDMLEGGE